MSLKIARRVLQTPLSAPSSQLPLTQLKPLLEKLLALAD